MWKTQRKSCIVYKRISTIHRTGVTGKPRMFGALESFYASHKLYDIGANWRLDGGLQAGNFLDYRWWAWFAGNWGWGAYCFYQSTSISRLLHSHNERVHCNAIVVNRQEWCYCCQRSHIHCQKRLSRPKSDIIRTSSTTRSIFTLI